MPQATKSRKNLKGPSWWIHQETHLWDLPQSQDPHYVSLIPDDLVPKPNMPLGFTKVPRATPYISDQIKLWQNKIHLQDLLQCQDPCHTCHISQTRSTDDKKKYPFRIHLRAMNHAIYIYNQMNSWQNQIHLRVASQCQEPRHISQTRRICDKQNVALSFTVVQRAMPYISD